MWWVAAAQVGMSMFQHSTNRRAAMQNIGAEVYQAETERHLQGMQTDFAWRTSTRMRRDKLERVQASQRSVFAARGITGGRSAQLSHMTSQLAAAREQKGADVARMFDTMSGDYLRAQQITAAQTQATQAVRQSRVDMISSILGTGLSLWEASKEAAAAAEAGG